MTKNSVKNSLGRFFDQFDAISDDDLPLCPVPDGATPEIFVGDQVGEGWIRWRPKLKDEVFDLLQLEKHADIFIHESVKEMLNSWWFCCLSVKFFDYQFDIDPVVPGNYKAAFLQRLLGYRNAHQHRIDYIPIGYEVEHNLLLVIRNITGEVCVEDFDAGSYEVICESLPKFFDTCG